MVPAGVPSLAQDKKQRDEMFQSNNFGICGVAKSQRKLAVTEITKWRNDDEFTTGKGKSQTHGYRKIPLTL